MENLDENKKAVREKELLELRKIAEGQFDKQIVYLSGGGLVFSIGFVKDIIGLDKAPISKELLFATWICFAISLIVNLFSYITARKTIDKEIIGEDCNSEIYDFITRFLNISSIITLLTGIVLLIWFSMLNF